LRSSRIVVLVLTFTLLLPLTCASASYAADAGPARAPDPRSPSLSASNPPKDDPGDWEVVIAPYVWMPWVNADVAAEDHSISTTVDPSDLLKAIDLGYMGTVEVMYRRRWFANLDTLFFILDQDTEVGPVFRRLGPVTVTRGGAVLTIPAATAMVGPLDVDMTLTQLVARVVLGYRLLSKPMSEIFGGGGAGDERKLDLDVFAGGRLWYLRTELDVDGAPISIPGTTGTISFPSRPSLELPGVTLAGISSGRIDTHVEDSVWWVDPIVGMRVRADLTDRYFLRTMGNVGGFNWGSASKFSWETLITAGFRPKEKWTIEGGYRALGLERVKGGGSADIIMHGPLAGFTYRF
jgi:hypothetical protein